MRGVNHFIDEERKHKYNSIAKVKAALKGEKDHDKIMDFVKKNYDLSNVDHADIVADIVGYYKIDPEEYFDEDGNLLEAVGSIILATSEADKEKAQEIAKKIDKDIYINGMGFVDTDIRDRSLKKIEQAFKKAGITYQAIMDSLQLDEAARNYIGQDFSQDTEYGIEFEDGQTLTGKIIHFGDSDSAESNWMSHFRPYFKNSNFKRDEKSTVIDYMKDGVEYMIIEITTKGHKPKYYFLSDVDVKLFELPKAPATSFPLPSGAIFDMSGDTVSLKQGSSEIELGLKDIKKLETLIKKAKRKYKIK